MLNKNCYPNGCLFIKFAAYRDYNSKENYLLENSNWKNTSANLKSFLSSIKDQGGWGSNGAIEIGLWYANQEDELNQIILLGDKGCNTLKEIEYKRFKMGES